jgi:hypothetical protein
MSQVALNIQGKSAQNIVKILFPTPKAAALIFYRPLAPESVLQLILTTPVPLA